MFTLKINMANAAFDNLETELARILRDVARLVEGEAVAGPVMDANGNTVGRFKLTPR